MTVKKVQLYLDRDKTIEASPETSANCVILSDGNDLQKVLDNDLTTPTVVHEETSFKVGVGDVNVSSSVVDGEVGRMVIKGKTYQNILPEPSTPVLTNNKEMFKVNEGLDPNVEVVDGISKSAILKGNTVINMCDDGVADASDLKRFTHNYTAGGGKFEEVSDGIKATTTVDNTWLIVGYDIRNQQKQAMTIGKKYYGVADITVHQLTNSDSCRIIFRSQYGLRESKSLVSGRGLVQQVFTYMSSEANQGWLAVGTNTQKAVIGDSFTLHSMSIYEITDEEANLSFEELANKYPVKCVGMQSVRMPVLTTTGKNLFNGEIEIGGVNATNGDDTSWKTNFRSSYMEVPKSDNEFVLEFKYKNNLMIDGWTVFVYYDKDRKRLSNESVGNNNSFKFNADAHYYRITQNISDDLDITDITDIQLRVKDSDNNYEPHKTNILSTPEEVVLRSLPNGVCDTLNLNTGEYVQRIGEHVLDGTTNNASRDWNICWTGYSTNTLTFEGYRPTKTLVNTNGSTTTTIPKNFICDKVKVLGFGSMWQNGQAIDREFSITTYTGGQLIFVIEKSKLASMDVSGFKQWLSQNPVTIQYELATPIIKTVDLSTSGNWERVVFDGSENWNKFQIDSMLRHSQFYIRIEDKLAGSKVMCDSFTVGSRQTTDNGGELVAGDGGNGKNVWVNILNSRLASLDVNGFKQYLQQNPMTVWYQTETHKDSTQVKQPIFFKDGHIQLSSGADNSLIPTLDYQAKTLNSYVMDLMKTNTRYTMKAKSASGTFTIDGTSYGAGTNGTFTTPSSMTNKLLVMSNKTNTEVMILEGDVVSKTIPYFQGIKSAFEDESKIEVLSTGKNLVDLSKGYHFASESDVTISNNTVSIKGNNTWTRFMIPVYLKANTHYTLTYNTSNAEGQITVRIKSDGSGDSKAGSFLNTWGDGMYYVSLNTTTHVGWVHFSDIQLIEGSEGHLQYEPHKSNNTKIPLLSPLRSLPNGVCDELIIDRMKKKAKIIQRIGKVVLDGEEDWTYEGKWQRWYSSCMNMARVNDYAIMLLSNSENLPAIKNNTFLRDDTYGISGYKLTSNYTNQNWIYIRQKNISNTQALQSFLSQNPITIYYELATPIIAEINLEGFPYIYKDGHIFLNSEITPVVEIGYNVNQSQQIQANNETLQRHELDILDLDNLIVSFVNAEYNLRLLKFDMEMSMMALAE